jgi:phytoene dehydrogenase-like protein
MAEFHFLKGTFKGRLGEVVFSSWRGTDYAKVYTPPGNPKTEAQEEHRGAWGTLGHIAKAIYDVILKPYTLPKPKKWTAFNEFMKINMEIIGSGAFSPGDLVIFNGPLPVSPLTAFTYDAAAKKLRTAWATTMSGTMRPTDKAICVLLQNEKVVAYGITTRDKGMLEIAIAEFSSIKNGSIRSYLTFCQEPDPDTDEQGMTSRTVYKITTIAGLTREGEEDEAPPVDEGKKA